MSVALPIQLHIPGSWPDAKALAEALTTTSADAYSLTDGALRGRGEQPGYPLAWGKRDAELPALFAAWASAPLPEAEQAAVAAHRSVAVLQAPAAPDRPALQALMRAVLAVLRAGGAGVWVNSTGLAHGPARWEWLTSFTFNRPARYYEAFVTQNGFDEDNQTVFSVGMHSFGLPDALAQVPDAGRLVEDFCLYLLYDKPKKPQPLTAFTFSPPFAEDTHFALSAEPDFVNEPTDATHNPHGFYRLRPVAAAQLPDPPTTGTVTLTTRYGEFVVRDEAGLLAQLAFSRGTPDEPTTGPLTSYAYLTTEGGKFNLSVLIDTTEAWAFLLLTPAAGYDDHTPSYRTDNPDASIGPYDQLTFLLDNGQQDVYPRHYCYPLAVLPEVLERYLRTGLATANDRKRPVRWLRNR